MIYNKICVDNTKSVDLIYTDGLVQKRRNSNALAMELRLSCTNPSIWDLNLVITVVTNLQAPNGAKPSTDTLQIIKLHMFSFRFLCISGTGLTTKWDLVFNPLRAKFFRLNINMYLHFMSFLHIDMTQVLKILPQIRSGHTYSI